MSTYTTNISLEKPAHGADADAWDVPVNADWDAIDAVFGGVTVLNAVGASGVVTLTLTQYRPRIIEISGLLTANVNYQLPATIGGTWSVFNNTTGAFTVTFSSAGGGSTVLLQQTYSTLILSDGTNIGYASTTPGAAGGASGQVQYNSGGLLVGSPNLVFDGVNVGIGVATPGAPLSVASSIRLYGSTTGFAGFTAAPSAGTTVWTLPTGDGSTGQVLTTNGAGVLNFTTVSGGGGTGVTSFSAGTTGLSPSGVSTGTITLGGVLGVGNGGTGSTTVGTWPILTATNSWGGSNTFSALTMFSGGFRASADSSINRSGGPSGYLFLGSGGTASIGYSGSAYAFGGTASSTYDCYFPNNAYAQAFVNLSDYRLKTNIFPLQFAGRPSNRLLQLRPLLYDMADRQGQEGFLAHELAEVVPFAVMGKKDAVKEDGSPAYQGVDYSKLVPLLTATVQELIARVAILEARAEA